LCAALAACGGGGGGDATQPIAVTNLPPTANAGSDQAVDEDSTVQLNGQGSDPEGSTLTYEWRQDSGPAVDIADTTNPDTTVTIPEVAISAATTVELTLIVSDADGASASDSVSISERSTDLLLYTLNGTLTLYDAATGATSALSQQNNVVRFSLSPDNRWVAYVTADDRLVIAATTTQRHRYQ
jgi:hypothetical protein